MLRILHFNDVYKMTRVEKINGKDAPILDKGKLTNNTFGHVIAFAEKIKQLRDTKTGGNTGGLQPLVLFSGDLFSPSVESTLTRGRNMVHLMNELAPDACVPGNHEFDFGRVRFDQLVEFSNFKWILSNVKELVSTRAGLGNSEEKSVTIKGLKEWDIVERHGFKIGIIGLMSADAWASTNSKSKGGLKLREMEKAAQELAKMLRQEKKCHLVIALTHAEHSEDVELARRMGAYPANSPMLKSSGEIIQLPDGKSEVFLNGEKALENIPGVDVIFGGHNHNYFLGRGAELDLKKSTGPTKVHHPQFPELHDVDLLIVKSGYDFNDLSEVLITIEDRPTGTERTKVDSAFVKPDSAMASVLDRQYRNEVLEGLRIPVAETDQPYEVDSEACRRGETQIGNWIADSLVEWFMRHADESMGQEHVIFIITGGSIRGDFTLGKGEITTSEIIELLPFETTLTSLLATGDDILNVLNRALSKSDRTDDGSLASSGRFPVVSGLRVEWNSNLPKENRVVKVHITDEHGRDGEKLDPEKPYRVLTNSYLAEGNSGFDRFKSAKSLTTYAELPMYQVLLNHINDLSSISVIRAIEVFNKMYRDRKPEDRSALVEDMNRKIQSLGPLLEESENFQTDNVWGNLSIIAKQVQQWLFGDSAEQYVPLIEIKDIDDRMKDMFDPNA